MPVVHLLRAAPRRSRRPARGPSSATSTRRRSASTPETVRAGADAAHEGRDRRPPVRQRRARRARSRRSACPVVEDAAQAAGSQRAGRARPARSARSRRSPSTRRRTSARSATAARSRRATTTLADRVADAALPRLARQGHLRAGRLQLAPRRAAGGDPARAAARTSTTGPTHRRAGRRAGTPRPGWASSSRCPSRRRARRRRGTCTSSAAERADELLGGPARPPASARAPYYRVPVHRQPAMASYVQDGEPDLPGTEEAARTHLALPISAVLTREQVDEVVAAVRPMRVWVDLTNSPHVLVLRPVVERLRAAGHEVRGHGARLRADRGAGRAPRAGRDGHRAPPRRAPGGQGAGAALAVGRARALGAAAALRPRARARLQRRHRRRADARDPVVDDVRLRVGHGAAHDQLPAGPGRRRARRDPARAAGALRRGREAPALPGPEGGVLPRRPRARPGRAGRARPGSRRRRSPSCARRPRCRSTTASSTPLFAQVLDRLRDQGQVVVLPRTPEQRAELRAQGGFIVPGTRSTGRRSSRYADLVVSAGGTMNREAVALGTPVWTTFEGRLGAVDERLIAEGRLRRLERAEDVALERRDPAASRDARARAPRPGAARRAADGARCGAADGRRRGYDPRMRRRLPVRRRVALGGLPAPPPLARRSWRSTRRSSRSPTSSPTGCGSTAGICRTATHDSAGRDDRRGSSSLALVVFVALPARAEAVALRDASATTSAIAPGRRRRDARAWPRSSRLTHPVTVPSLASGEVTRDRRRPASSRCSSCSRSLLVGGARFVARLVYERPRRGFRARKDARRVLIVGAGDGGRLVLREILRNPALRPQRRSASSTTTRSSGARGSTACACSARTDRPRRASSTRPSPTR